MQDVNHILVVIYETEKEIFNHMHTEKISYWKWVLKVNYFLLDELETIHVYPWQCCHKKLDIFSIYSHHQWWNM